MSWISDLAALERTGQPAVLVTVLTARGSAPREAGCKMVIAATALHGTIGGGRLEHEATSIARALLAGGDGPLTRDFPLGPALGQCCGGHVRLLFEPVRPPAWQVALFGAGHVGRAVADLLAKLDCRLAWIDQRAEQFPVGANAGVTADPVAEVASLPPGAFALVMTHDHQLDYAITAACLRRGDLGFVGLIGSQTKRARFASRLARDGIDISALVCPIGLPGIGGKLPAEIAIAVVAQLMQLRRSPARLPEAAMPCAARGCACP